MLYASGLQIRASVSGVTVTFCNNMIRFHREVPEIRSLHARTPRRYTNISTAECRWNDNAIRRDTSRPRTGCALSVNWRHHSNRSLVDHVYRSPTFGDWESHGRINGPSRLKTRTFMNLISTPRHSCAAISAEVILLRRRRTASETRASSQIHGPRPSRPCPRHPSFESIYGQDDKRPKTATTRAPARGLAPPHGRVARSRRHTPRTCHLSFC